MVCWSEIARCASITTVAAGSLWLAAAFDSQSSEGDQSQSRETLAVRGNTHVGDTNAIPSEGAYQVDPLVPPIVLAGTQASKALDATWYRKQLASRQLFNESRRELSRFDHDSRASFHAHGEKVCASGCAASRHPTEELTSAHFDELLLEFRTGPLSGDNLALETLLYYGPQSRKLLDAPGHPPLPTAHELFLRQELQRTHALVSIRVVDGEGVTRSWIEASRVPLDRRHVFAMRTDRLQPLVTSGTVKRVGLNHLWTRL